jgi:hypothetical protein
MRGSCRSKDNGRGLEGEVGVLRRAEGRAEGRGEKRYMVKGGIGFVSSH